ncbi:MAG: ATP-dependent DNA helicase RecG [Dehalococcoidia bacterium]|nr:ATP-dependent DNA helicase RecG [Dehalococcoidia bacterium]MQG15694.1 ATP-dependent DNA helicase RecG [SAR202 cluster bacterium]|tara:strand:- start:14168 stop:16594 length:2427 start_codon:yes stop_codon:yes gene_type:complete
MSTSAHRTSKNTSKTEILRRIIEQEIASGYEDRAVIGGIDNFINKWSSELSPVIGRSSSYAILSHEERKAWINEIIQRFRTNTEDRKNIRRSSASSNTNDLKLLSPISRLKISGGIRKYIPQLKKLGIYNIEDALYHFPHRHNDFRRIVKISELKHGLEQTIIASVWEATESRYGNRGRSTSTQAILGDDTGNIKAIWHNQGYLARSLRSGTNIVISGIVKTFKGRHIFESPAYEILSGQENLMHAGRMVPIYPATDKLPVRTLRRLVKASLDVGLGQVIEYMPKVVLQRQGLMDLKTAISKIHFPDSDSELTSARRRLAFDELMMIQLSVLKRRNEWHTQSEGIPLKGKSDLVTRFIASLPFILTDAQTRVLSEVNKDLADSKPMIRLLQGDVGSGKTVIAAVALLKAVDSGFQGAFMAPTELLAEQHYLTLVRLLQNAAVNLIKHKDYIEIKFDNKRDVNIALLTGSLKKTSKDRLAKLISDEGIDIVVGTHALIQSSVDISNLAVGVVDEQHRFGVMQRSSLGDREIKPHILSMSATPIPRSLALTLYGDSDVSVLDEMPIGRKQVKTRWIAGDQRSAAYDFVKQELNEGHQAFIVFPLIEESDSVNARSAIEEHHRLSADVFREYKVGLLHGRMKTQQKETVMQQFIKGELNVLVSTSVIEVGIDVPNATVMVIDGADRFGLAQLHQFRGRVGRSDDQSYCLLLSDSLGSESIERLRVIENVSDGFELAEEDLRIRGPGDAIGTRQSGLPILKVARISDLETTSQARKEAAMILEQDPGLEADQNLRLASRLSTILDKSFVFSD